MNTSYPKKFFPDRYTFIKLGFKFYESYDGNSYNYELPKGWKEVPDQSNTRNLNLIDALGNVRATYPKDSARRTVIKLKTRYYIEVIRPDIGTSADFCVIDRKEDKILFSINSAIEHMENKNAYILSKEVLSSHRKELRECRNFLTKKFPNWQDPTAYWS